MRIFRIEFILFLGLLGATLVYNLLSDQNNETEITGTPYISSPHLIVLGVAQDAGYPQANCKKSCCTEVWNDKSKRKMVSCLGLRDPESGKVWMFDATPDFKDQLSLLQQDFSKKFAIGGIFLTHAHMGHYTGLMHLGREAMGSDSVAVYTMPRMKAYLEENGPWSQLVDLKNISLVPIQDNSRIQLSEKIKVTPFLVPHRDEFSETVGYRIEGPNKSALFIPDIDKWEKWSQDINELIKEVDYALLDGTFYQNGEIWGRDMSEIPHPFIVESMERFESLSDDDKSKIKFIHLNHTNPLLRESSEEYLDFTQSGFGLAMEEEIISL